MQNVFFHYLWAEISRNSWKDLTVYFEIAGRARNDGKANDNNARHCGLDPQSLFLKTILKKIVLKNTFIILVFAILLFSACSHRQPDQTLNKIEHIIAGSPQLALDLLEALLPAYDSFSDAEKAKFGILYFNAVNRTHRNFPSFDYINFSVEHYRGSRRNRPLLARALLYKSRAYQELHLFEQASFLLFEALKYADRNDYRLLGLIYNSKGFISRMMQDIPTSLQHFNTALHYAALSSNNRNHALVLSQILFTYHLQDDFSRTKEFAEQMLSLSDDADVLDIVFFDLSTYYRRQNKYDSAKYYVRKALAASNKRNRASRYLRLADLYFRAEQYDNALHYADASFPYLRDYFDRRNYYRIRTNVAMMRYDMPTMTNYLRYFNVYNERITALESQTSLASAAEMHARQTEVRRVRRNNTLIVYIIIMVVMVSAFLIIYVRSGAKKQKKEYYEKELQIKKAELQKLLDSIYKLRDEEVAKHPRMTFAERDKAFVNACKQVLHYDDEVVFTEKMNRQFKDIISKLKQDCPSLKYNDLLYCCLFLLGMKAKEIALVLGQEESSVRSIKKRIADKMSFEKNADFEKYLKEFLMC